jgi:hypothetical protein
MKNYQEIYEQKLKELKESVLGSEISDQLELKAIGNRKIEAITDKMTKIVGKPVWEDFSFRTGKILGIMRFILQNPKHRQQLLEVTGLTQDYLDIYYEVCGNLPYVNTTNNTLNAGRPMDIKKTRELIKIVAAKFDLVITDNDLSDITQEKWDRLYASALERAAETVKFNEQNNPDVGEAPTTYDE